MPSEGVAIDDPFPPQTDGLTDPLLADAAIRWAYQHWILVDLDPAVRARIVEDGEQNTVTLERGIADARGTIDRAGVAVDEVRLTGVDTAEVRFRLRWQDGPSPIFPDPITGTAVFQNGSWRISGRTRCVCSRSASVSSASPMPRSSRPRGSARARSPIGFQWLGEPGFEGVMRVPGGGYWMLSEEMIDEQPRRTRPQHLVRCAARLGDTDGCRPRGDRPEREPAPALTERVPIEIDDARGWIETQPGFTNIVLIRPDDVLVLAGGQVTATELMAILGELEPIDLPAGFPRARGRRRIRRRNRRCDGLSFDI